MKSKEKILSALLKIQNRINQKIPQPSNRYEILECVPKGTDLDQAILKLKDNRNFVIAKTIEYEVAQQLNAKLTLLMRQKGSTTPSELSEQDWGNLQNDLLNENSRICAKLGKTLKHLHPDKVISAADIETAIRNNILSLQRSENLSISSELAQRFNDDTKVAEHRHICESQFRIPAYLYVDKINGKERLETAKKIMYFWHGLYFSKSNIHVGYCDEHACLALKEIFEEQLFFIIKDTIEKVSVEYGDGVNHTFLVLRRDPNSALDDISTWGKKAILFDPWNRVMCLASEYESLPVRYPLLHKQGKWSSIKFTSADWHLFYNLRKLDTYWAMTGNESPEVRLPLVMEEYQLTSIATSEFAETKLLLAKLGKALQPENFDSDIEFFITTSSEDLVSVINGFDEPKIAIHKDLLANVPHQFSFDELRFSVARALHQIKYHGGASNDEISAEEHHFLDNLALKKCKNATAAISYLRKSNQFAKKNSGSKFNRILAPVVRWASVTKWTYEQRIKNLMTLLAKDESLRTSIEANDELPACIAKELQPIKKSLFFADKFNACQTKLEKINVLTTCLSDLKVELLPYELVNSPGIRVRHFCHLITTINIDFKDPAQVAAVHDLINNAAQLRVPGFDLIYLAICGIKPDTPSIPRLPALGPFKELQLAINEFINANNAGQAEKAAEKMNTLLNLLNGHFKRSGHSDTHLYKYKKVHNNSLPRDRERYFGSSLGKHIAWASFKDIKDSESLPWELHSKWALQSKKSTIATALWKIGVTRDTRIWSKLGTNILLKWVNKEPIVRLSGKLAPYSHVSYTQDSTFDYRKLVMDYVSKRHVLITDMFTPSTPFKEALETFLKVNLPALASPGLSGTINVDNPAIQFLLGQFAKVAISGNDEEKKIVKDFFLNQNSDLSLSKLLISPKHCCGNLKYNFPYVQFVIEQQFNETHFNLFTNAEIIDFVKRYLHEGVPLKIYLRLYNLSFNASSFACVTQLLPLMKTNHLTDAYGILISHLQKNRYPLLSSSTEKILRLAFDSFHSHKYRRTIVEYFSWDLQISDAQLENLSCDMLITIYRSFDTVLAFPDQEQQALLGRVILGKIEKIKDVHERIKALEELLYSDSQYCPLSDFHLRSVAINLLVEAFFSFYGEDDGSDIYYNKIKPMIDRVFKKAYKQDKRSILSKVAVRVESQTRVNEYLGIHFEPDKYCPIDTKKSEPDPVIGTLANMCQLLSENVEDQQQFLEFISSPLTENSIQSFSDYLVTHKKLNSLFRLANYDFETQSTSSVEKQTVITFIIKNLYYEFWDLSITQRAVIINYLLMPANTVASESSSQTAYKNAFIYVANKLFPNADSLPDENFALAILKSYLDSADPYERDYLLSAMLVASNDAQRSSRSVGKKLAMICEHMGPPYIKLVQALHSHPDTPAHIRCDLKHVKSHADPLERWELERLISETLPVQERENIQHLGSLLGCASYNLALEAKLKNNEKVVLSLCRENAAYKAKQGFRHLAATMQNCKHPRMEKIRDMGLATLRESESLSDLEMDSKASAKQFEIAKQIYNFNINLDVKGVTFHIQMKPVSLLSNGKGYRFIELAHGVEFNEIDKSIPKNILLRKAVAKAVIIKELINILSGDYFDSDRHGNQLRVLVDPFSHDITLGLYDFGELFLDKPHETELRQLAGLIHDLPSAVMKSMLFSSCFDTLLSAHIKKAIEKGQSPNFLMRIRKAFLALQDFQGDLSMLELIEVIKHLYFKEKIHPIIRSAITGCMEFINRAEKVLKAADLLMSPFRFFSRPKESAAADVPLHSLSNASI